MSRIRVIADEKIPFLKGVLEGKAEVRYLPGKAIDREAVQHADALITRTRTRCDKDLLAGSPVKFIATATIGFDHIDTAWCGANHIIWTNAPGCNSSSVQQYMVSALLHLFSNLNLNPAKLTIGIIGVGNVGSKVTLAAETLGMKVLLNDPPRERAEKSGLFCSIDEITDKADIISFHVPLNKDGQDKTWHMAGESFFNKLIKPCILINTSRGPVVKGDELKKAILEKKIKGCVLDVWENEPDIDTELLRMVDFGTPHIAGYSTDGKVNGTTMSVRALSRFFSLGMDEWYPPEVPEPQQGILECDCTGKDELAILKEIYHQTYDISDDDGRLRENTGNFEYFRGNYPFRREPAAYKVKLVNNTFRDLPGKLIKLGFQLQT